MLVQIDNGDIRTFAGVKRSNCATDAAICPGNQRNLPVQATAPGTAWLPFWLGHQCGLVAWQTVFMNHGLCGGH